MTSSDSEGEPEVVASLFGGDPNPYEALSRVLAQPRRQQRSMLRLEVWCDASRHTPVRVFSVREGLLVQCRSEANVKDMQEKYPHLGEWSKRGAFFVDEWRKHGSGLSPMSHLQVVCDCAQTVPSLVSVEKLAALTPDDSSNYRAKMREVAADVR